MAKVALTKGDDRKDNIRKALELVSDEINLNGRTPVIKLNFVAAYKPLSATHKDAAQAVVEFLKDRGEKNITLAEGATLGSTSKAFRDYGYEPLIKEHDLNIIDLNDPEEWITVFAIHPDMRPHPIKLHQTMVDQGNYIISLTRLKTHIQVGVTLATKNVIMGSVLLTDRFRMHPSDAGNKVLDFNLFNIMQHLHIDLAVLDGFEGMQGGGPVNGDPIDHGVALAGTDYVAVDRVGTEIMGADFDDIRYLNYLWDYEFGEGNLANIHVVGDTIENCRLNYEMNQRFLRMRRQEGKGQLQELAVYA
jgi:uncharacterized protein (DUF362 family)